MLPLVDKPIIQYVVEEAARCGFDAIVLVTGRGKQAIENHFDVAYELEETLEHRFKMDEVKLVRDITNLARFTYVRQGKALGLGHAVLAARDAVGEEPFALLLGDDVFDDRDPALQALVEIYQATGKSVVGVQEVPLEHVSKYGIVNGPAGPGACWDVHDIVEKPSPDLTPSRWAVVGRYILTPPIFELLAKLEPGVGGEYQLTDALAILARDNQLVAAPIPAKRYDTGNKLEYLKANIDFALRREDIREGLKSFLIESAQALQKEPGKANLEPR
jgi:UTP--glucose-1-phosphate uridylyltransferase